MFIRERNLPTHACGPPVRHKYRLGQLLLPHRWTMASMVMIAVLLVTTEGLAFGSVLLLLNSNRSGRFAFLRHVAPDLSTRIEQLSFGAHVRIAALVLILITLVRGGLQYIQHLQTLRLRRRVERSLQVRVFERFHDLSLGALQRYR